MRNQAESRKLKDTIVHMALYDHEEVEPNVFKPLTMASIGRACGVTRERVRQILEECKTNLPMLKRRTAYRDRRYRAALKATRFVLRTREYYVYFNMLGRCFNKKHPDYKQYGGRGVTVCARWLGKQGFQTFMLDFGRFDPNVKGNGKRATFSIHRIDNVPLYSPATVKWATQKEQCAPGQRRRRER